MSDLRLYVHKPQIVFVGLLDMAEPTGPIDTLTYDTVVFGAYADIGEGMTVTLGSAGGADDFGRGRVRLTATATNIYVGRSSDGYNDGEFHIVPSLVGTSYITVWRDYRVWSKIPHILTDGTIVKDGLIGPGTNMSQPPPVANTGPPAVGTIDSGTGKLRVRLPPVANTSFAVAQAASITNYQWLVPSTATYVNSTIATDSVIDVDFPAGFHYVSLTVTDSNSKTHKAWTWVLAIDPANDLSVDNWQVTNHVIRPEGQSLTVRVFDEMPSEDYLPGSLVVMWEGEPSALNNRDNLRFWGWHHAEPAAIAASRTGLERYVDLTCVDTAGRLAQLPGFSVSVANELTRDTALQYQQSWSYMSNPTMDRFIHYLLQWHSTALSVTDYIPSGTAGTFPFVIFEAGGATLYEQVDRQAQRLVPNHVFTCDRNGALRVRPDPIVQHIPDRTATVSGNIHEGEWSEIRYAEQRTPRVHWLRESALLAHATTLTPLFSIAPGKAPGQGAQEQVHGEQLAPSQDALNIATGHRYARLNARQTLFDITLAGTGNYTFDPARMEWVALNIPLALAAQRELYFASQRGLIQEMTIRYQHTRTGLVRSTTVRWERETWGGIGVTDTPPELEPLPAP